MQVAGRCCEGAYDGGTRPTPKLNSSVMSQILFGEPTKKLRRGTTNLALIVSMRPADMARHLRINSHTYKIDAAQESAIHDCADSGTNAQEHLHVLPIEIVACDEDESWNDVGENELNRLEMAEDTGKVTNKGVDGQCWT